MGQNELNVRSQFRGFLFELAIGRLLEMNNFKRVVVRDEPDDHVREKRPGFTEFRGRGCWHQIDCPYDYKLTIPFSFPLRLLGEVKFLQGTVRKDDIREFIGVVKDIQENYFPDLDIPIEQQYPRKQEIGIFVSANGFDDEAEYLAYAHCIKTFSYDNNPMLYQIKKAIYTLSKDYLVPSELNADSRPKLRRIFQQELRYADESFKSLHFFRDGYDPILQNLFYNLFKIRASFIGVTNTGLFLHFVSNFHFPFYLFHNSDNAYCQIYYDKVASTLANFRLVFSDDHFKGMFFFSPPRAFLKVASNPSEALFFKEAHFQEIKVNIFDEDRRIVRSLRLQLDPMWVNVARQKISYAE